jgi:Protein of unknown function (DUF2569)
MCGSSVLAAPPPMSDGPMLSSRPRAVARPGFSKWLFFIGLSLVVTPAVRVYAIVERQIPVLFSDEGQAMLAQHPGLDKLVSFEIGMNALLVLAALVLNLLFYSWSKHFPKAMIAYVALTFAYLLAVTAAVNSLFPDALLAQRAQSFYSLLRYLIWGVVMAGYLLFNPDVKTRFEN